MALSISQEIFAFSVGRAMFSAVETSAYNNSVVGGMFAMRGIIQGNSEKLMVALQQEVASREEEEKKVFKV